MVDYMIDLRQTAWAVLWRCKWTRTSASRRSMPRSTSEGRRCLLLLQRLDMPLYITNIYSLYYWLLFEQVRHVCWQYLPWSHRSVENFLTWECQKLSMAQDIAGIDTFGQVRYLFSYLQLLSEVSFRYKVSNLFPCQLWVLFCSLEQSQECCKF